MFVRVRYTTAIVAAFSLVVLVAVSYLTGRHTGRGPASASASASASAEEIAAGPIEKGVADFGARPVPSVTSTPAAVPAAAALTPAAAFTSSQRAPAQRPTTGVSAPPSPSNPTRPPEPAAAAPPKNVTRTLNLQYVIVQGYPPEEKQMAIEACQYLNAARIPSTVETGVIGPWNATWFYVVGVRPFERASGPEYEAYRAAINEVSNKFAGKSRFKRFEPTGTRWRGTRTSG
jgi:hypothetical protein